jgi:hypothetical protein
MREINRGIKKEDVVKELVTLYNDNKQSTYRVTNELEWIENQKLYLSRLDAKTFPWEGASNVDLGIVEMTVDNIKSRYAMSTIAEKPFFNALPRTSMGETNRKLVQEAMSWVLDEHLNIGLVTDKVTHNLAKHGTCFTKRRWTIPTREITRMSFDQQAGMQTETGWLAEPRGIVDVPDLQHLFFPEEADDDIQNCHYNFHRVFLSESDLKHRMDKDSPFGYDKEGTEKTLVSLRKKMQDRQKTAAQKNEKIPQQLSQDKAEILECYVFFDGDKDGYDEQMIFTICPEANAYLKGRFLADVYFDGMRPFNRFVYKDVGLLYGRGIPQMLKNYREAMNTIFNQGVDCTMMQIIPWFFYRYASSFKPEEVKLCPGKGIPVDDINDVRIATFPATAPIVEQVINLMMTFVERQTGISAPMQGEPSGSRTTAYEVGTIISEGNIKHQDRIISFHREYSNMLEGIYHLYRQNMTSDMVMRLAPDDPQKGQYLYPQADPKSFLPEYDFIILGNLTMGNKQSEMQLTNALYDKLMANPFIINNPKAIVQCLKDLLNSYDKRNITNYLPPEEVTNALQDAQQKKVMAEAASGFQDGGQPGGPGQQGGGANGGAPGTK